MANEFNAHSVSDPTSYSLLDRVKDNDQQAWHQLVHVYGPLVLRWCRRAGLNNDDSADVSQDVFRAVAANLAKFEPIHDSGSFRSWLKTITRTKVIDHFRRTEHQPAGRGGTTAQLHISELADPLRDDDEEEAEDEQAVIVTRALDLIRDDITPQNWQAFQQVAMEGKSAVEVAESLGVSAQTVRQANYRIRRKLRLLLQDLFAE